MTVDGRFSGGMDSRVRTDVVEVLVVFGAATRVVVGAATRVTGGGGARLTGRSADRVTALVRTVGVGEAKGTSIGSLTGATIGVGVGVGFFARFRFSRLST